MPRFYKKKRFRRKYGAYKKKYFRRRGYGRRKKWVRRRKTKTSYIWRCVTNPTQLSLPPPMTQWGTNLQTTRWRLVDVADYAYLVNEFTYYKLVQQRIYFKLQGSSVCPIAPIITAGATGPVVTNSYEYPAIAWYTDKDGTPNVAQLTTLRDEPSAHCKQLRLNKVVCMKGGMWYQTPVYTGATAPFQYVGKKGWIDVSAPNIYHYGLIWDYAMNNCLTDWTGVKVMYTVWIKIGLKQIDTRKKPWLGF